MKRHLSHLICILAVAGLAFISRDRWGTERTLCPNHALASRLTEEHRLHGVIDTSKYKALDAAGAEQLLRSSSGVCLISESTSGDLHSRHVFLHQEQKTGKYYLVFDGDLGGADKVAFGPIAE